MGFGTEEEIVDSIKTYCISRGMSLHAYQLDREKGFFRVSSGEEQKIIKIDSVRSNVEAVRDLLVLQAEHCHGEALKVVGAYFTKAGLCWLPDSLLDAVISPLALGDGVDFIYAAKQLYSINLACAGANQSSQELLQLADYMWQQLNGLREAIHWIHENSCFFSDFKPENIWIYPDGWKIGDLKSFSNVNKSWLDSILTLCYFAPDVIGQMITLNKNKADKIKTNCSPGDRVAQENLNVDYVIGVILVLGSTDEVEKRRKSCFDEAIRPRAMNETMSQQFTRVDGALRELKEINMGDKGFFPRLKNLAQQRASIMVEECEEKKQEEGDRTPGGVEEILSQMTPGFFQMKTFSPDQVMADVNSDDDLNISRPQSLCLIL